MKKITAYSELNKPANAVLFSFVYVSGLLENLIIETVKTKGMLGQIVTDFVYMDKEDISTIREKGTGIYLVTFNGMDAFLFYEKTEQSERGAVVSLEDTNNFRRVISRYFS